jgi:hypothetical protein
VFPGLPQAVYFKLVNVYRGGWSVTDWSTSQPYPQILDSAGKKRGRDEHASLLRRCMSDNEEKKFYKIDPQTSLFSGNVPIYFLSKK